MFRSIGQEMGYKDILSFNQDSEVVKAVDSMVDNKTKIIGKERLQDNIVFDSRLAWHFIPNSYKVFIDVNIDTAARRLIEAKRNSEKVQSTTDAKHSLQERWSTENNRYQELYQTDNLDLNNYDLVIDSSDKTPEEIADIIHKEYQKIMRKP